MEYGIYSRARNSDRMLALWHMHQLVSSDRWLALDTECTGLGAFDQVIEVSICDPDLHTWTWRIKPTVRIEEEATQIHGITEADLQDAQTYAEVWPQIEEVIDYRPAAMYHADYDYQRLYASARAHKMRRPAINPRWCVMVAFAQFYGKKNGRGEYIPKSLKDACLHVGIPLNESQLHTSSYDAQLTIQLARFLAEEYIRRS